MGHATGTNLCPPVGLEEFGKNPYYCCGCLVLFTLFRTSPHSQGTKASKTTHCNKVTPSFPSHLQSPKEAGGIKVWAWHALHHIQLMKPYPVTLTLMWALQFGYDFICGTGSSVLGDRAPKSTGKSVHARAVQAADLGLIQRGGGASSIVDLDMSCCTAQKTAADKQTRPELLVKVKPQSRKTS